jgi:nitrogen fixation/metabolism regulation signal transduction histidine kinase
MDKVAVGPRRDDRRSYVAAVEVQSYQRLAELGHSHRHSVVGEIAATISHEINQPLGAIVTNAETLEVLLRSPASDLTELREIAADIRRDSQRAADVIRRLRNFLERSTVELREIDLAEPVRDALRFFSALAVARNSNISSSIAPIPLPVKGNAVQLHQVILTLYRERDGRDVGVARRSTQDINYDQARAKFCGSGRLRQGTGHPVRQVRGNFRSLFLQQGANGNGIVHRPNYRRSAWRSDMGREQDRERRGVSRQTSA